MQLDARTLASARVLTRPRRMVATLAVLACAAVGTVALQDEDAVATQRARCESNTAGSVARERIVTGSGQDVLVIGDSWSAGLGLDDLTDSWPVRLPGRVRVAGYSGSGFSRGSSPCGPVSYAARAARVVPSGAPLVVVEGGLNDVDQPPAQVALGFLQLMRVLDQRDVGRVVVVGPAPAPARAQSVARVDRLLAGLAAGAGVTYVSAAEWDLTYQPDALHPDVVGHQVFGDAVAAALSTD